MEDSSSAVRLAPRLPIPGTQGTVKWRKTKEELIMAKPGEWLLIGQNVPTRIPGRPSYAAKQWGADFMAKFGVEIYAHHLPPRHDDLPSGYNIYVRKSRQKKEAGK